jgi:hypothetical protein
MKKFGLHLLLTAAICVVLANCKHEPPPEPELPCQYDSSIERNEEVVLLQNRIMVGVRGTNYWRSGYADRLL